MVIRPLVVANGALGELGRSAAKRGNFGGSAAFLSGGDTVTLGAPPAGSKTYAASPLFKMMGAVELMSPEFDPPANERSDTAVPF